MSSSSSSPFPLQPLVEIPTGLKYSDYTVAFICPLPEELTAVRNMLDELHKPPLLPMNHKNSYTFGRMCGHNVVLAGCGGMGPTEAAALGSGMDNTFQIRFALLVGIAGGLNVHVPGKDEIYLGDVVICKGYGKDGGVIDYGLGRQAEDGFQPHSFLNAAPPLLKRVFSALESKYMDADSKAAEYISGAIKRNLKFGKWARPDPEKVRDVLFDLEYKHQGDEGNLCTHCDNTKIIRERTDKITEPAVHFGLVLSGNQVIANSQKKADILKAHPRALAIEMEGAGLMNLFGCATIRGISDYADGHKNPQWRLYAAAAAAAVAREVLDNIPKEEVLALPVRTAPG